MIHFPFAAGHPGLYRIYKVQIGTDLLYWTWGQMLESVYHQQTWDNAKPSGRWLDQVAECMKWIKDTREPQDTLDFKKVDEDAPTTTTDWMQSVGTENNMKVLEKNVVEQTFVLTHV